MYVIGHNTPGIQYQSFLLNTMRQALRYDINIIFPCKQVDPVDDGEAYEVGLP